MDITLELSQAKYPPTSYLRTMWADNVNALLALPITAVLGGVSGRVTDGSGAPVAGAVVSVAGISKSTRSRGATGYFNKPLAPGSYSVSVSAPGFRSKTQAVVVPANTTGAVANFVLARTSRRRASGQAAMVVPAAAQAAVAP
jgi:carboxypeptidase D